MKQSEGSMGCIQSKPEKGKGLLPQQKEIIRQGNNNKDDSEKVSWSNVTISEHCQQLVFSFAVDKIICCCCCLQT